MGMFDYIDTPARVCPVCGNGKVQGWQSKDGPRLMRTISPIDVRTFHGICNACGAVSQYQVKIVQYSIEHVQPATETATEQGPPREIPDTSSRGLHLRAPSSRATVYAAIDSERDYQISKWGPEHDQVHTRPEPWLVYIQEYLGQAFHDATRLLDDVALSANRKNLRIIAALAVAALEQLGVENRTC